MNIHYIVAGDDDSGGHLYLRVLSQVHKKSEVLGTTSGMGLTSRTNLMYAVVFMLNYFIDLFSLV